MSIRKAFLAATAAATVFTSVASAQPAWVPPGNDRNGYYSDADHNGYYDRSGTYRRIQDRDDRYDRRNNVPPPPPPAAYYEEGRYEQNCQRGNQAAGTIFGAIAGGLLGSAASRGNGGAVVGGAILGGLLGNAVTRDIDCEDQPVAFRVYAQGLNGQIGRRYDWRSPRGSDYGYFTPTREFRRGGTVCREWTETTYRRGRAITHSGTACRQDDGNWRFD